MHQITRIFHPVGQGAFYSERHTIGNEKFNIVYDCGSVSKKEYQESIAASISSSFRKSDEIDILFISHFDRDHVNQIELLKETVGKIKTVICPLLNDEQIYLLETLLASNDDRDLVDLVKDTQGFFGEETRIVGIKEISPEEHPQDDGLGINIVECAGEFPSGTKFALGKNINWTFIPYNYKFTERYSEFQIILDNEYVKNHSYKPVIDKLRAKELITDKNEQSIIKKLYDKLPGKINENSMFLYSGPIQNIMVIDDYHHSSYCSSCYCHSLFYETKVGCLYTGDGNLKTLYKHDVNICTLLPKYADFIGTVQIPHHGSIKDFEIKFFKNKRFICPICFGNNNTYGHPSGKIIKDLLLNKSTPVLISEEQQTIFFQYFCIE